MIFIQRWDLKTSQFCLLHSYNQLQAQVSRYISKTGDGPLYLMIGGLCWLFEPLVGHTFFVTALKAFALELPIYWLLKNSFKRSRPINLPVFIVPSDRYSLPSGHTAAAFLMADVLAVFYPTLNAIYYIWATLISLSRLFLGVHYFSDLVAGALLGTLCAEFVLMA